MPLYSLRKQFLDRLVQNRFQPRDKVREIVDDMERVERRHTSLQRPRSVKGVHNGQFYRVAVPPRRRILPNVPKLHNPTGPPMSFQKGRSSSRSEESSAGSTSSSSYSAKKRQSDRFHESWERFKDWCKENYGVMLLNVGSVCTLAAFTRSDVLELRVLSATGSLLSVGYFLVQKPVKLVAMMWSSTFAAVNGVKIYAILQERKGYVSFSAEQEGIYVKYFLEHGITPKQFETIESHAEVVRLPKEKILIRQGEKLEYVYLIVKGSTRANILGRYLTAASVNSRKKVQSGAWVGEMAFLESYWDKEKGKKGSTVEDEKRNGKQQQHKQETKGKSGSPKKSTSSDSAIGTQPLQRMSQSQKETGKIDDKAFDKATEENTDNPSQSSSRFSLQPLLRLFGARKGHSEDDSAATNKKDPKETQNKKASPPKIQTKAVREQDGDENDHISSDQDKKHHESANAMQYQSSRSLFTIVAAEDCTIYRWSHADMEKLMERSNDMRAALTRAMTAAIVSKVVNFTVSRSSSTLTWSSWFDELRNGLGSGVQVNVQQDDPDEVDAAAEEGTTSAESTAQVPVKKFG